MSTNLSRINESAHTDEQDSFIRSPFVEAVFILASIMKQAEALYEDYPMAM
ncbi:MAG: hypothetical protein HY741_15975 [Chloroflexi bacterium]|nr:hypothetical protein [Chloroflexota bacterium]